MTVFNVSKLVVIALLLTKLGVYVSDDSHFRFLDEKWDLLEKRLGELVDEFGRRLEEVEDGVSGSNRLAVAVFALTRKAIEWTAPASVAIQRIAHSVVAPALSLLATAAQWIRSNGQDPRKHCEVLASQA